MTVYTVGESDGGEESINDTSVAADSEIRFYEAVSDNGGNSGNGNGGYSLRELPRDKFIRLVSTDDFLDLKGLSGKEQKELQALIPFPTVRYVVSPDGLTLTADLTVGEFIGKEDLARLAPYLHRERHYTWTGTKWRLTPE